MREPNWDAMLMAGNPYEKEPEIELILKDLCALYDEAKKEYDFWDKIARSPHESYEQEGIILNRAKVEGKMIAFKHVIEMFEDPSE